MIILEMLNCGAAPAQIGIAMDPYGEGLREHIIYSLVKVHCCFCRMALLSQ
jgi:hypothetical protein